MQETSHIVLLLTLAAIVALLAFWFLPKYQARLIADLTPKERFENENESRKTLAQVVAGLAVIISLYSAMQTLRLARLSR